MQSTQRNGGANGSESPSAERKLSRSQLRGIRGDSNASLALRGRRYDVDRPDLVGVARGANHENSERANHRNADDCNSDSDQHE